MNTNEQAIIRTEVIRKLLTTGSYSVVDLQHFATVKMNRSRRWSASSIRKSLAELDAVKDGESFTLFV
jgi:hypothetical protein